MVTYHDLTFKMNNNSNKYECIASADITAEQLEVVTNANGIATSNANDIANSTATSNATIIGGHTQ